MKSKLAIIAVAGLPLIAIARGETNTAISPDRITLYAVPLVCPAAPAIGCGSRSKPILTELENEGPVSEAWLNRPGTLMAVVWKPETKRKDRTAAIERVSKREELKAHEMKGSARKEALKDFVSREGWYRSNEVDRLSEEEAGIIAARLVRRIQAKVSLTEEKANVLQSEFTDIFKRRFTGPQDDNEPNPEQRVLGVLQSHLNEKDVTMLKETLPHNMRPLPGEK